MYYLMTKIWARFTKAFITILLTVIAFSLTYICCQSGDSHYQPGLVGIYYSEPNLTSIKAVVVLTSLEQNWGEMVDFQTGSSGVWEGYIIAPADGQISFYLQTNKIAILEIDNDFKTESNQGLTSLNIKMNKDQAYPISVTFYNDGGPTDYGYFTIKEKYHRYLQFILNILKKI
jgi:hypothetical protein